MNEYVKYENNLYVYKNAVFYMDDDIREKLHLKLSPCTNQKFFDEYIKEHEKKYNENFIEKLDKE